MVAAGQFKAPTRVQVLAKLVFKLFFWLIFLRIQVKERRAALTGCGSTRHNVAIFVAWLGLSCGTVASPAWPNNLTGLDVPRYEIHM
jgi:hypothetical protein